MGWRWIEVLGKKVAVFRGSGGFYLEIRAYKWACFVLRNFGVEFGVKVSRSCGIGSISDSPAQFVLDRERQRSRTLTIKVDNRLPLR